MNDLKEAIKRKNWFVNRFSVPFNYSMLLSNGKFEKDDDFIKKVKAFFIKLSKEKGWNCLLSFSKDDENDRLHCHGEVFVPKGAFPGKLVPIWYFSPEKKDYIFSKFESDYFLEHFGRNSFYKKEEE